MNSFLSNRYVPLSLLLYSLISILFCGSPKYIIFLLYFGFYVFQIPDNINFNLARHFSPFRLYTSSLLYYYYSCCLTKIFMLLFIENSCKVFFMVTYYLVTTLKIFILYEIRTYEFTTDKHLP